LDRLGFVDVGAVFGSDDACVVDEDVDVADIFLYGLGGGFYGGEVGDIAGDAVDGAGALGVARCVGLEVVGGFLEDVGAPAEEVYAFSAILVEGGRDGESETCGGKLVVGLRVEREHAET
jgi:hypothetical protein